MTISSRKILVIDDEVDIVDVISAYVKELGFEADSAVNGGDALEKARKNDYYAIFCDYKMPGLNGLGIYKMIISKKPYVKSRFVMTTGTILEGEIEEILRREGIPILKKPFRLRHISELLEQCSQKGP